MFWLHPSPPLSIPAAAAPFAAAADRRRAQRRLSRGDPRPGRGALGRRRQGFRRGRVRRRRRRRRGALLEGLRRAEVRTARRGAADSPRSRVDLSAERLARRRRGALDRHAVHAETGGGAPRSCSAAARHRPDADGADCPARSTLGTPGGGGARRPGRPAHARTVRRSLRSGPCRQRRGGALDQEELQLYALDGLMQMDSARALPILEKILAGDRRCRSSSAPSSSSGRASRRAPARSSSRPPRAAGPTSSSSHAVRSLGIAGEVEDVKALSDVYRTIELERP